MDQLQEPLCSVSGVVQTQFFLENSVIRLCVRSSNHYDAMWSLSKSTKIAQTRSLKAIQVKSSRHCKSTKMYAGQFKLSFIGNKDRLDDFGKVSSDFVTILNFPKLRHIKKVVKCQNHRSDVGTSLQCIRSGQNLVFS